MKLRSKARRIAVLAGATTVVLGAGMATSGSAYGYLDSGTVTVHGGAACPFLMLPTTAHITLDDGQVADVTFDPLNAYNYTTVFTNVPLFGVHGSATYECAGLFGTAHVIDRTVTIARPVGAETTENLSPS